MLKKYEAFYQRYRVWVDGYPWLIGLIRFCNKGATFLFYGLYPVFLLALAGDAVKGGSGLSLSLFLEEDPRLLKCILVPGVSFVLLSVIRRWIKRPRPYVALNIRPLIQKNDIYDSMPSRHVFSATMIAMTIMTVWPLAGGILLVCSLILAVTRVMAGIHYPSDVAAGFLAGLGCGLIYYI